VAIPGRGDRRNKAEFFVASEDAGRFADEAVALLESAVGVQWYEHGTAVDRAAITLCRLRRARAGEQGAPERGDAAVRNALAQASPEALVWIASRAISYMDENGFPEAVEAWFPDTGPD